MTLPKTSTRILLPPIIDLTQQSSVSDCSVCAELKQHMSVYNLGTRSVIDRLCFTIGNTFLISHHLFCACESPSTCGFTCQPWTFENAYTGFGSQAANPILVFHDDRFHIEINKKRVKSFVRADTADTRRHLKSLADPTLYCKDDFKHAQDIRGTVHQVFFFMFISQTQERTGGGEREEKEREKIQNIFCA